MRKKIGILTYHHVINDGAILQTYSTAESIKKTIKDVDVEVVDFRMRVKETESLFALFRSIIKLNSPMSVIKRYIIFKRCINNMLPISKDRLISDDYYKSIKFISNKYDLLIVGSDEVWKIENGKFARPFPNIYWLDEKIRCPKIALSVSANRTEYKRLDINTKEKIKKKIGQFDLIGVRDEHTFNFVKAIDSEVNNIYKVPDPTVTFKLDRRYNLSNKLKKLGVNLDKPLLAMIIASIDNKRMNFCKKVYQVYKKKGYQVIGLSLHNKYVDINLSGKLNPFEWSHLFKYFTFCITDRFHGTIFSLKNGIPFLTVDHKNYYTRIESKTHDLLKDLSLLDHHIHLNNVKDDLLKILEKAENGFNKELTDKKIKEMEFKYYKFIKKINDYL